MNYKGVFIGAVCVMAAAPLSVANPGGAVSPIYGVGIPEGYRQWELISVAHETSFDELRAVLGNAAAANTSRAGRLPFPDGSIFVKLAWRHAPLPNAAGAFVAGSPTTVQVMVKDSKRYAATGGWGFGRFIDGAPVDEAQHATCFACHAMNANAHDYVFTRFAP